MAELGSAAPYLIQALKVVLIPSVRHRRVPKTFQGDFIDMSLTLDLTLSDLDNGLLTGTGSPERFARMSKRGVPIRPP